MDSFAPYPLSDCMTYIRHWHGERGVNAKLLAFTLYQASYMLWVSADCITSLPAMFSLFNLYIMQQNTLNKQVLKPGLIQIVHD